MEHEGCTASFKPDHRWDLDDEVCRIRKFYGPKRAINTSANEGQYPAYLLKECPQCGWQYWAGERTTSPTCRVCWGLRSIRQRACPRCNELHRDQASHCRRCRISGKVCVDCGLPVGLPNYLRCGPCHKATLDPVKLKAQRRRTSNARRARKQAAMVAGPVPLRVYREVVESGPCVYCGEEADTVDHIQPLAKGGHEAEYNLVPACGYCNSSKCDRQLNEWVGHEHDVRYAVRYNEKVAAVWNQLVNA